MVINKNILTGTIASENMFNTEMRIVIYLEKCSRG